MVSSGAKPREASVWEARVALWGVRTPVSHMGGLWGWRRGGRTTGRRLWRRYLRASPGAGRENQGRGTFWVLEPQRSLTRTGCAGWGVGWGVGICWEAAAGAATPGLPVVVALVAAHPRPPRHHPPAAAQPPRRPPMSAAPAEDHYAQKTRETRSSAATSL